MGPSVELFKPRQAVNSRYFNPTGAIGANSVNHDFAIEYNEVWNASLQHQFGSSTTIEAEYMASRTATTIESAGPRSFPDTS